MVLQIEINYPFFFVALVRVHELNWPKSDFKDAIDKLEGSEKDFTV